MENFTDNSMATESQEPVTQENFTQETQPSYDPATSTSSDRMSLVQSLLNSNPTQEEVEPVLDENVSNLIQEEEQPIEPQLEIPDKFKNADGSPNLEALVKSYTNMEQLYSKSQNVQQFEAVQQQNQLLQQMLEQQQSLMQQANQTEAQPQVDLEAQKEAWFERFYENPMEAIAELAKQSIEPVISPIIKETQYNQQVSEWGQKVNQAKATYQDFDLLQPQIAEIIEQRPYLADLPDALDIAYKMAKADQVQAEPKIEDMLKNPEFLKELSKNPDIEKQVLSAYSQNLNSEPKPPVMGNQPGGAAPATPPQEITSIKDASRASASFFAKIFGGS